MVYYLYDGTIEGFLTVVFEKYTTKQTADIIITKEKGEKILMGDKEYIETDSEKSDRVAKAILSKGKYLMFRDILLCFSSEEKMKENFIFDYIKMCVDRTGEIRNYSDKIEKKIDEISRRASFEVHRLKGLVRFEKLKNGILYSKIEPDNDILSFMIPHFEKRLPEEKWVMHDVSRKKLFYHDGSNTEEYSGGELIIDEKFLESDDEIAKLWKKYHESIAVRERENPKLQKQFMPKRYWKYLTEKR